LKSLCVTGGIHPTANKLSNRKTKTGHRLRRFHGFFSLKPLLICENQCNLWLKFLNLC
jgi:hypothetical protein